MYRHSALQEYMTSTKRAGKLNDTSRDVAHESEKTQILHGQRPYDGTSVTTRTHSTCDGGGEFDKYSLLHCRISSDAGKGTSKEK